MNTQALPECGCHIRVAGTFGMTLLDVVGISSVCGLDMPRSVEEIRSGLGSRHLLVGQILIG